MHTSLFIRTNNDYFQEYLSSSLISHFPLVFWDFSEVMSFKSLTAQTVQFRLGIAAPFG